MINVRYIGNVNDDDEDKEDKVEKGSDSDKKALSGNDQVNNIES